MVSFAPSINWTFSLSSVFNKYSLNALLCTVLDVRVEAVNRTEKTPCPMVIMEGRTDEQSGDYVPRTMTESGRDVTQSR